MPVDQIDTSDVLRVLSPIWTMVPSLAERVLQRTDTIRKWARVKKLRPDNLCDDIRQALPKQLKSDNHWGALPCQRIAEFMATLDGLTREEITRLSVEFQILTAVRPNEARQIDFKEIDWRAKVWTVPAPRMKSKKGETKAHVVPLSERALAILERAKEINNGEGKMFRTKRGEPASSTTYQKVAIDVLTVMGIGERDATLHGMRSSFRDWGGETTNFPHELLEKALAHKIKNKAETAYNRGDFLEKRRALMDAWAAKCRPSVATNVIEMKRPAAVAS